ncbi:MAG TPA: ferredoxin [Nitrososphaerales archaeon]|nr:ferredoxin [Nitrososphaerales archaeon]
MDDALTELLWITFGIAVLVTLAKILKWQSELHESGWWTGVVVEGKKLDVRVDHNLCMGASSCVELAPDVFHLDWSKKKSIFDPAPLEALSGAGADPEKLYMAAQSCPYRAIFLRDAVTGEHVFP